MDLPGPQHSYLRQFGPRGQILGPRALWPYIKKLLFSTKPSNIGVYGLAWIPATTLKVIWTRGPNFWSKGPLAPNSKICNFLTKPHKMGVYGITWTPAIILGWFWPWGQIFAPRVLWPQIQKFAIFSQNPTIWVSMDSPEPKQSCLR